MFNYMVSSRNAIGVPEMQRLTRARMGKVGLRVMLEKQVRFD